MPSSIDCVGVSDGCEGGEAASTVPAPPARPSIRSSFISRQFACKIRGWRPYRIEHLSCVNCNHTVARARPYATIRERLGCMMHCATRLDGAPGIGRGHAAARPCRVFFCRGWRNDRRMSGLSPHQRSLNERDWLPCVYLLRPVRSSLVGVPEIDQGGGSRGFGTGHARFGMSSPLMTAGRATKASSTRFTLRKSAAPTNSPAS